jgi:hypothetical protein
MTFLRFLRLFRRTWAPCSRGWRTAGVCLVAVICGFALMGSLHLTRACAAASTSGLWVADRSAVDARLEGEVRSVLQGCLVGSRLLGEYGSSCVDLSTDEEGWIRVLLAPRWYLQHIGLNIEVGDFITVQGAPIDTGLGTVFFATRVWSEAVQYELRDARGGTLWLNAFPLQ